MLVLVLPALALTILAFTAVCGWLIFSVDETDLQSLTDVSEWEPAEAIQPRSRQSGHSKRLAD